MITVKDINNEHNNALFNDDEYLLSYEYMQRLAARQNNTGCSLLLSQDGKVLTFIIN